MQTFVRHTLEKKWKPQKPQVPTTIAGHYADRKSTKRDGQKANELEFGNYGRNEDRDDRDGIF